MDEPIVTVNVTVGCLSKVSRQFVVFLDPPLLRLAQSGAAETPALPPQRVDSQVAPLVAIVQGSADDVAPRPAAATDPTANPASHARLRSPRSAAAAGQGARPLPRRPRQRSPRQNARAAPRAAARRRRARRSALRALPARACSSKLPSRCARQRSPLQPAPCPSRCRRPPDPSLAAASAALGEQRERIQRLEAGIARLRSEAQATERTLAALQARLRQAEDGRYSNPLVLALAALSLLLAGVAGLGWRRALRRDPWWNAPASATGASAPAANAPAAAPRAEAAQALADELAHDDPPWTYQPTLAPDADAIGGLEVTTVLAPAGSVAPDTVIDANGARGIAGRSADRPRAAGRILHRARPGRGRDRPADRAPARQRRRQPAAVPGAARDLAPPRRPQCVRTAARRVSRTLPRRGPGLGCRPAAARCRSHPETLARLQALWSDPADAQRQLGRLLFRRDEPAEALRARGLPRSAAAVFDRPRPGRTAAMPTLPRSTCCCRSSTPRTTRRCCTWSRAPC